MDCILAHATLFELVAGGEELEQVDCLEVEAELHGLRTDETETLSRMWPKSVAVACLVSP